MALEGKAPNGLNGLRFDCDLKDLSRNWDRGGVSYKSDYKNTGSDVDAHNSKDSALVNYHTKQNCFVIPTVEVSAQGDIVTDKKGIIQDTLLLYDTVRSWGVPNFMGARIPLNHNLDMQKWRAYTYCIQEPQVLDLLEYGFPVGYTAPWWPESSNINHPSALHYPDHVDKYIATEIAHGSVIGPMSQQPFTTFVTSPLMSREKKNSDRRRVITDFSFGDYSVNGGIPRDCYLGVPCKLHLPSAWDLRDRIVQQGKGCLMWSRDIARAYKQLRSCPLDYPLLGIRWKAQLYLDISISFGIRYGAKAMQGTTTAVTDILRCEGYDVLNYIDDLAGVHKDEDKALAAYNRTAELLAELGLVEAKDKATAPSTTMIWLGVEFDSVAMEMRIPKTKLEDAAALLQQWWWRTHCTRGQLRSLLGKLFHLAACCPTLRLFVNRLLEFLRACPDKGSMAIPSEARADLAWVTRYLPTYNGIAMIAPNPTLATCITVDSCLSGAGGHYGKQWFEYTFPPWIVRENHCISDLEMLNIVVAVKLWSHLLAGHVVHIRCDNEAAVSVLNTGRGRSPFLLACAREIWQCTAEFGYEVVCSHIRGVDNDLADLLSRCHLSQDGRRQVAALAAKESATLLAVDPALLKLTSDFNAKYYE